MILIRSEARNLPLADESVQCCVTSPPYWGLRSYRGNPHMIGLEPTFEEHLANLVAVFREVRRVLRKDGTVWLNYGDAYAGSGKGFTKHGTVGGYKQSTNVGSLGGMPMTGITDGYKPKDLMLMPARVALALQADGWWVRSEIVWHKPNPMPESVTDRPTNAHEKVFLLTKSARYFYDAEAVRVPRTADSIARDSRANYTVPETPPGQPAHSGMLTRRTNWDAMSKEEQQANGANLRNVWTIATQGVSAAHFATFPEKVVEPCILAGTSAEGACAKCGAPWARVTRPPSGGTTGKSWHDHSEDLVTGNSKAAGCPSDYSPKQTTGWNPACSCQAPKVPCTVLDPFVGSGTVCRVATRLNRRGIGCDLGYQDIAEKRTTNVQRVLI